MLLENFIYLRKQGFIFGYVPKVCCTNWKSIFRYLEGHADYLNAQLAHDRSRGGLLYLDTMPRPDALALLEDHAIRRYTFVRNPYTRVLSAYLNKIKIYAEDGADPATDAYFHSVYRVIDIWRQRYRPSVESVTFGIFLAWIEMSGDPMARNEHWLPQTEIIGDDLGRFDFVGRFEQVETDARELLARIGCDISFPSRDALQFPGNETQERMSKYYGATETATAARIYKKDFEILEKGN